MLCPLPLHPAHICYVCWVKFNVRAICYLMSSPSLADRNSDFSRVGKTRVDWRPTNTVQRQEADVQDTVLTFVNGVRRNKASQCLRNA